MIKRIKKKYTKAQILKLLDPIIKEWFDNGFQNLTPPQALAIPLIHKRKNVLVSSPTGSGKTLTAFLMIINELFELSRTAKLENKVYCVYISPLKALANDIERNLNLPLEQIYSLANQRGITLPEIRVGVRSGDTSTAERQKMTKKAPHILITTPESLSLIVSTKLFRHKLLDTRFVIVDEIHELCSSKRGVLLSLTLERLQQQILSEGFGREFIRIGLSATQAPIREIAKFLVGYNKKQKLRDINIIETPATKKLDLRVLCPVQDMNLIPFEIVNAKMYNILHELIEKHRTTLIFTNTRSGTETVVYKLQEQGIDQIAAHHGSLSKEMRLEVEEKLKNGELNATISSTSLELGIDIGYIDLVCQIGSPKSIAKGLQRIGRAGHALHEISKGRIIVFDRDDLVECAVLVKNAYDGNIDRVNILKNSQDVLAQALVGMSLEKRWEVEEAYSVIKQSYCFHKLPMKDFMSVMKYIAGKHSVEERGVYGKLRYHLDTQTFGIRRGARIIYNLNIGTIPQEANYKVISKDSGMPVGALSEKFVERLTGRDVFVLGGKSYEYIQVRGMIVYVRDAHGKKPTVPSWSGEMLPRSFDLSTEVGKFRAAVAKRLEGASHTEVEHWLEKEYYLDTGSARSIVNYFIEQMGMIKELPTDKQILIEGYIDGRGYYNIIFHYCFGRRINDALSRAYAYALSKKLKCTIRISLSDDNFMLTLPKRVELSGIEKIVTNETLRKYLKNALHSTELFKQRFRHCAVRSFMILRNYKGREISVRKQLKRAHSMLDLLRELDNFPVINESYNEILHDAMDIIHAEEVLEKISKNEITVHYSGFSDIPSPFSHNIILIGVSDIILMEDRSALLRELHQQVLGKVFGELELAKPKFETEIVKKYFKNKFPVVNDKASLYSALKSVGPLQLFKEKGRNIYSLSTAGREQIQTWAAELIDEQKLVSVIRNNELFWIPHEHLKYYLKIYSNDANLTDAEKTILDWLATDGADGRYVPLHIGKPTAFQTEANTIKLPLPIIELHRTLKTLEKRLLIHRLTAEDEKGIIWCTGSVIAQKSRESAQNIDSEAALGFLLTQYLNYFAPTTMTEIAYDLNIEEGQISRLLSDFEDSNYIIPGNYVLGKDVPQYLLAKDLATLEQSIKSAQKLRVIDQNTVRDYLYNKTFEPVSDIEAYFEKFGIAFGLREIFLRTDEFCLAKWNKLLATKKVVQGRFLNGHVSYIPTTELPIYTSAYRQASLTDQELTVLQQIKLQRGITRQELAKKLDANQVVLKEIIDKLERNLYIIRELTNDEEPDYSGKYIATGGGIGGRVANKYMSNELPGRVPNAELEIIRKLLKGYAPMTEQDLQNYTGFSKKVVENCLNSLLNTSEIEKFIAVGDNNSEMYILTSELNSLEREKDGFEAESRQENKMKILSIFDGFSARLMSELRIKFGEGWQAPLVYYGYLIGTLDMWRLSGCIEIRDITLDDNLISQIQRIHNNRLQDGPIELLSAHILKQILDELNNLMVYYKEYGLDIIRIRGVFGIEANSLPKEVQDVLSTSGYVNVQNFYVKGSLESVVYSSKQIMRFILQNQHILPRYKFTNPLTVIRTMGGIRSNFEMHLRLDGRFYDIKEFRKNLNLVAGPMIPESYLFCTEKDLQIYKAAKGRELDFNMEYVLGNMPDEFSISSNNLFNRLTLTKDQYNSARKQLYEGLFIIRDPMNRFKKVTSHPNLTKAYARKYVLKRIIKNFGIFSLEGLAMFTKREFSTKELRILLRELEDEGFLVKGYFIENDETLYWMYKDGLNKISSKKLRFSKRFIVSPQDQLAAYLAPIMRQKFGSSSYYIIFHGFEISGAFKTKRKNKKVWVTEFIGNDDDWGAIEEFCRFNKLDLIDKESEELYSDFDE